MKVRELQEHLSKLDPEIDVVCYSEDENLLVERRGFILFDIVDVSMRVVEPIRLNDQTPYIKFVEGSASVPKAIVEITSDF